MANTTKQTPASKIEKNLATLTVVSEKLAKREHLMTLTKEPELIAELKDMSKRYLEDVEYLRRNTISQFFKATEKMTVAQFSKFAGEVLKVIS